MIGSAPNSTGSADSAAYTSTPRHPLRVTVTPDNRYAMPFRPYVYRGGVAQRPVSRNP